MYMKRSLQTIDFCRAKHLERVREKETNRLALPRPIGRTIVTSHIHVHVYQENVPVKSVLC